MNGLNIFQPIAQGLQLGMQREQMNAANLQRQQAQQQQQNFQGMLQSGNIKGAAAIDPAKATQFQNLISGIDKSEMSDLGLKMAFATQLPDEQMIEAISEISDPDGNFIKKGFSELDLSNPDKARASLLSGVKFMADQGIINPLGASAIESSEIKIKEESNRLRSLELAERNLDRQIAREKNELERQKLQQQLDKTKNEINSKKREKQAQAESALNTNAETFRVVDELLNHPGLNAAVGASSILPTLPGGDAANFEAKLEQLKSQQFLNGVESLKGLGALSNAEGAKISAAASALELGMSESEFRKELNTIMNTLNKSRDWLKDKYNVDTESLVSRSGSAPNEAIDYLIKNPQFKEQFKQKYGYLPEGI